MTLPKDDKKAAALYKALGRMTLLSRGGTFLIVRWGLAWMSLLWLECLGCHNSIQLVDIPTACTFDAGPDALRSADSGTWYANAGVLNPLNDCQACAPEFSPDSWTNLEVGTRCGDAGGMFCSAQHACRPGCLIGGVLKGSGDLATDGSCLVCDPSKTDTAWSPLQCPATKVCADSRCVDGCNIEGEFVVPGPDPANSCLVCANQQSTTSWSFAPRGTPCNGTGTCMNGACGCLGYPALFAAPGLVQADGTSWQLLSTDLNFDGLPDLVDLTWGGVLVFLGLPDGGFATPTRYLLLEQVIAGVVQDLNEDGVPDLAVVTGDGSILQILWGQGDGELVPGPTYSMEFGGPAYKIAAAQRSGGAPDLIACSLRGVLLFQNDGAGDFSVQQIRQPEVLVDGSCKDVVVADLSGSGRGDVIANVWVEDGGSQTIVRLSVGPRSYGPPQALPAWGPAAVGDFDGDGDLDLALFTTTGMQLFLNQGGGNLRAGGLTPLAEVDPNAVVVSDLNGDCWPDLVVAMGRGGCDGSSSGDLVALLNEEPTRGTFRPVGLKNGGAGQAGVAVASFPGARPVVAATAWCNGQLSLISELR